MQMDEYRRYLHDKTSRSANCLPTAPASNAWLCKLPVSQVSEKRSSDIQDYRYLDRHAYLRGRFM